MNILLPTDFSENAEIACQFAFDLAKRSQGRVEVLHAYDLPYSDRSMTTSLLEVMKDNAENNMAEFKKELEAKYPDTPFNTRVNLGNPIRIIHEIANDSNIDMVVMGTKGASGLEEILIGSNAASVIQNTVKPVMVIPPKAQLQAVEKIIFASDLDPKVRSEPLKQLADFAALNGAKIDVVHVQKEGGAPEGGRERLREILADHIQEFTILHRDKIEKSIAEEADKENAQVIAAIAKRYGFFEGLFHRSVTSRLAYQSHRPLLVLHEPK